MVDGVWQDPVFNYIAFNSLKVWCSLVQLKQQIGKTIQSVQRIIKKDSIVLPVKRLYFLYPIREGILDLYNSLWLIQTQPLLYLVISVRQFIFFIAFPAAAVSRISAYFLCFPTFLSFSGLVVRFLAVRQLYFPTSLKLSATCLRFKKKTVCWFETKTKRGILWCVVQNIPNRVGVL